MREHQYWQEQKKWFESDEDKIPHKPDYTTLKFKAKKRRCQWCKKDRNERSFFPFQLRLRNKKVWKSACLSCYSSEDFHNRINQLEEDYETMTFYQRKEKRSNYKD
tara:strand:+ start:1711 stop:2028 length:318 start_codon:yes stop_codon:yes gene_type:complete